MHHCILSFWNSEFSMLFCQQFIYLLYFYVFHALPLLHDTFLYSGPTGWWVTLDLIMSSCIIFLWGILLWYYRMIFHVVVQTSRRCKLVDRNPESWRVPDWHKCPCFLSPIGHHRYRRNAVGVSLCKNANFKELSTTGVSRQDSPGLNKELLARIYWKQLRLRQHKRFCFEFGYFDLLRWSL